MFFRFSLHLLRCCYACVSFLQHIVYFIRYHVPYMLIYSYFHRFPDCKKEPGFTSKMFRVLFLPYIFMNFFRPAWTRIQHHSPSSLRHTAGCAHPWSPWRSRDRFRFLRMRGFSPYRLYRTLSRDSGSPPPGSEDVRMQKFRPLSQRQAASKNSVFPECLSWYL